VLKKAIHGGVKGAWGVKNLEKALVPVGDTNRDSRVPFSPQPGLKLPALAVAHRSPLVPVARALVSVHQQNRD
jgi:hypothetical protein